MMSMARRRSATWLGSIAAVLLSLVATTASAETLLMPKRDFLMGASEVVWGVTDQANGTAFTLDYGDGSADTVGNVADRSYIAFNHTYATAGTFTVTLTVGVEVATVVVNVYDASTLSAFDLRGLNINRTIQNGLRYLWYSQTNRAGNFPAGVTTDWGGYQSPFAALIVLAFENHGYRLPNNNSAPTGIYEKYVVRRGLNMVLDKLSTLNLTMQTAGDPCVGGLGPAPCTGIEARQYGDPGYETSIAMLPLAASGALNRTVAEIAGVSSGGYVVGKSYGEVLQRLTNALSYGQNDSGTGRGGWYYFFNSTSSDGSTIGWNMIAFLDAAAAGAAVPAFVKPEYAATALPNAINNDGSYDYQADANRNSNGSVNVAKTGVGLQGMFFAGRHVDDSDPDALNAVTWISNRWNAPIAESFLCNNGTTNKGCAYGMFNVYKAFKLQNVLTLPGVTRPAGPGPIPAGDWHADYQDWLVTNQTSPTSMTGGYWGQAGALNLVFSSQYSHDPVEAAIAELILAPVALVLPDPTKFSTVGLSPANATNPPGTSHTLTATATSANDTPVAGATVQFRVIAGPNAGKTGSDITDGQGKAHFTYTDTSAAPHGTDTIQAFIGALESNQVFKTWALATMVCDADGDSDVDNTDLTLIRNANGQQPGANDPRDGNQDGKINVADVRYCSLRKT